MRISVQTAPAVSSNNIDGGYKNIADAGFEAVDFNIDCFMNVNKLQTATELKRLSIYEKSVDEIVEYMRPHLDAMKKYGIAIAQAHAPFPPYFAGRKDILDYMIEVYKKIIAVCDIIDCPYLVIHGIKHFPSSVEPYAVSRQLDAYMYDSLIDTLKDKKVVVCLENLPTNSNGKFIESICCNPHDAARQIDELNEKAGREAFGFCLDTGHMLLVGKRFETFVPILGSRLKTLHLNDNDGVLDRHLAPFAGQLNWEDFINSMRDVGYKGDLSFETCAQIAKPGIDEELTREILRHICTVGRIFRKKILK
ncbi:MAG: sugar phosphate isomerase/epimerase [Ruminococcaceae bacterium]|nr:sugar phosphate isomerase/epimerase [Oscillospiraceae bacterium]